MDDDPVVETGFTSRTPVEPPESFIEQANVDASDVAAFNSSWPECWRRAADLLESERPVDGPVESMLDEVSTQLLTIRDLERVGDHAVNIAARTLYMVENDEELIY